VTEHGKGARWLFVLALAAAASGDTAVPAEGPILRGVVADPSKQEVRIDDKSVPFSRFLLVEKDDGTPVWGPDFAGRVRAYRRMVTEGRRAEIVALTKKAIAARDHETARRLFEWALQEGLQGRDERVLRKRVEAAEKKPREARAEQRDAVLREESRLRALLPDLLMARAAADPEHALALAAEVLATDPAHEHALALVRERMPKASPFPEPKAWLDWHLRLERRGFSLAPDDLYALRRARHLWRPDLFGIQADGMLVLTPIRRLDVVAGCAGRARITLETLEGLFRTDTPRTRTKEPLTIQLFENRKNFAEGVGYEGAATLPPYFHFELGHWTLRDDLTRLLAPEGLRDPDDPHLAYALVHELTRHWLWSRCPRFATTEAVHAGPVAGYALAAGFAGFMAEGRFDMASGTVDLSGRESAALEFVRKRPEALLDWSKFLLMSYDDIHAVNTTDPALTEEGRKRGLLAAGRVFAFQGAATCNFLYNGENGRHRQQLVDYLVAHYTGDMPKLNPSVAFGLRPAELGKAVVAWASAK